MNMHGCQSAVNIRLNKTGMEQSVVVRLDVLPTSTQMCAFKTHIYK